MGMAGGVEAESRALDLLVDPGFVAPGAGLEDVAERAVASHREAARANPARQ